MNFIQNIFLNSLGGALQMLFVVLFAHFLGFGSSGSTTT